MFAEAVAKEMNSQVEDVTSRRRPVHPARVAFAARARAAGYQPQDIAEFLGSFSVCGAQARNAVSSNGAVNSLIRALSPLLAGCGAE